jgi:acyl carrier protein
MMTADVLTTIEDFIYLNFGLDPAIVGPEFSLLEEGLIDSGGLLEVVLFLEERFDIMILDEEVIPEHFESICCMEAFVVRKLGAQPASAFSAGLA